jgi:hypothetical protein
MAAKLRHVTDVNLLYLVVVLHRCCVQLTASLQTALPPLPG